LSGLIQNKPYKKRQIRKDFLEPPLKVAGLFSGIGGVELGMSKSGHENVLFCEIDEGAKAVLSNKFKQVKIISDVRKLSKLPENVNTLTGGFPCQDLSQAGKGAGIIRGKESSLVGEVFRIVKSNSIENVIIENVPFMLSLDSGKAMEVLTSSFEELGYSWAYRVVDSACFGVPQRRQRVIFLATKALDPREILFSDVTELPILDKNSLGEFACGFYWTEGIRGLGWAVDSVPTIKGGSTIGIPSPPAICLPCGMIGTPDIRDTERMQGFPEDWTKPASRVQRNSMRWKLIGNAVTVNVFEWIGSRFRAPNPEGRNVCGWEIREGKKWPSSGWNVGEGRFGLELSYFPANFKRKPMKDWLKYPLKPLSERATRGFLSRLERSKLNFPNGFESLIRKHLVDRY